MSTITSRHYQVRLLIFRFFANIGSQYNTKWNFFIEVSYSWIREVSNTYIWIFLDRVIVKLLWFAFLILFNIIVAPVSTTSRYGAKKFCLGHPQLVITGCHFWLRAFFRSSFLFGIAHPRLLIFGLFVGPPFY